ncbi:MAG TPA: glycosyltransferase family 4 protein [Bryobacteraceae bacterium]|jgi:glycosyltransferase involved in cell wall biosynthesis
MQPLRVLAILEATTITGPAKNLLEFARLAREERFDPRAEVAIATFRREGDSNVFLDAAAQAGVTVHAIPERGRFDRSVIPRLRALVGELKPDIVQTHAVKSHMLLRTSGLHRELPWVAFHHGYTWPDLRARVYNQFDRWSLRFARRVVTVSLPFRDELTARGVEAARISVLHNAIDPNWGSERDEALRAELRIPADRKVILIVGRLSREKDHLTLLDAVEAVRKQGGAVPHLLIVGEGPERAPIEEQIRGLRLEGNVTMTGQVASARRYYGIADVAVLSSRSEGSPNALLEAMAARVPVVATAVGGVPEIATDRESALLIAPGDREAMARSLGELLSNRELAESLRANAHRLIEERYSPDRRVCALCEIYREVLARP